MLNWLVADARYGEGCGGGGGAPYDVSQLVLEASLVVRPAETMTGQEGGVVLSSEEGRKGSLGDQVGALGAVGALGDVGQGELDFGSHCYLP